MSMTQQRRFFLVTLGALALGLLAYALLILRPQTIAFRRAVGTAASLRALASAMESYADDHEGSYPAPTVLVIAGTRAGPVKPYASWHTPDAWPVQSQQQASQLVPYLSPYFGSSSALDAALTDEWGHAIICGITADHRSYTLLSVGPDGHQDRAHSYRWPNPLPSGDLVISQHAFLSLPAGVDSGGANGHRSAQ